MQSSKHPPIRTKKPGQVGQGQAVPHKCPRGCRQQGFQGRRLAENAQCGQGHFGEKQPTWLWPRDLSQPTRGEVSHIVTGASGWYLIPSDNVIFQRNWGRGSWGQGGSK